MRKMPKGFKSKRLVAFSVFFILLSDQISKFVVANSMKLGESVNILPFFNITRVENKGVTFGLLSEAVQPLILILLSLAVVVSLVVWARNNRHYLLPVSMIISGAVGNMIDRVTHEAVIDFLDFYAFGFHWPAFNIADSAIVIGVAVLFFVSYKEEGL